MNEKVFFMTKRIILAAAASTLLLAGPALAAQTVGASATVPAVPAIPAVPSLGSPAVPAASASGSASADLTAPPADVAVTPTGSDPLAPATGKAAKAKKRAR
jgi:hypothetical protein